MNIHYYLSHLLSTAHRVKRSPAYRARGSSFTKSPPLTPSVSEHGQPFHVYQPSNASSSVTGFTNQTSISGTNLDTVVDVPNNNLRIYAKDFHSSTKSVPNTNGSFSPPAVDNRQHLCLQTSFNSVNLEPEEKSDSGNRMYLAPTDGGGTLSKSTPIVSVFTI